MELKRIVSGMSLYGASDALNALSRIGVTIVLTRYLEPSTFGILAILYVTATLYALIAQGGLPGIIMSEFRVEQARRNHELMDQAYFVCSVSVVVLSLLFVYGSVQVSRIQISAFQLLLLNVWMATSSLSHVPAVYLRFMNRVGAYSIIQSVKAFCLVFVIIYGYLNNRIDLTLIIAAEAISSTVAYLLYHVFAGYIPSLPKTWELGRLFHLAFPLFLTGIVYFILDLTDRYLISLFMDIGATGYYSIATRIAVVGSLLAEAFYSMWLPNYFRLAAVSTTLLQDLRRYFNTFVTLGSATVGICIVLVSAAISVQINGVSLIHSQYRSVLPLVPILLLQYFFKIIFYFCIPLLVFASKNWAVLGMVSLGAGLNLGMNMFVLHFFRGSPAVVALGWVAAATVIAYAVSMVGGLYRAHKIMPDLKASILNLTAHSTIVSGLAILSSVLLAGLR